MHRKQLSTLTGRGLHITEACAVEYGRWFTVYSDHSVKIYNRISRLLRCEAAPPRIIPFDRPKPGA
jgi:hypothetical protein